MLSGLFAVGDDPRVDSVWAVYGDRKATGKWYGWGDFVQYDNYHENTARSSPRGRWLFGFSGRLSAVVYQHSVSGNLTSVVFRYRWSSWTYARNIMCKHISCAWHNIDPCLLTNFTSLRTRWKYSNWQGKKSNSHKLTEPEVRPKVRLYR